MTFIMGFYGSNDPVRYETLLPVCSLLGAQLRVFTDPPTERAHTNDQIAINIWYIGHTMLPPIPLQAHTDFNLYILKEKDNREYGFNASIDSSVLFIDYLTIPFDPEEFALRIIARSVKRGHSIEYTFDPLFNQRVSNFLNSFSWYKQ